MTFADPAAPLASPTLGCLARYHFADHGLLRLVLPNTHQIDDGVWRSGQPSPGQIRAWANRGIRTVISLRGESSASFVRLERQTCEEVGIDCRFLKLSSRVAPEPAAIRAAADLLASVRQPMLLHCKSGVDRAGMMAVIYLYLVAGKRLEDARQQLSMRYLHCTAGPTGILDFFWDTFARAEAETGVDFWTWLARDYCPVDLKQRFKPQPVATWIVDKVLRRE